MRCPQCNKFVSLEFADIDEPDDLEISEEGDVTGSVRIVRTCAECGEELKEATLEFSESVDIGDHHGDGHELSITCDTPEQVEEGGGRYAKSYFGAIVRCDVECTCQKDPIAEVVLEDKIAASGMDEMV